MAKKHRKKHGEWYLRAWRKHRGLTQDTLAVMAGISTPYLSQLETGKRQYTQELVEVLARALGCAPFDLIARRPEDAEFWHSLYDGLREDQRRQVTEIVKTFKRTGTEG